MACVHHLPREDITEKGKEGEGCSATTQDGTLDRHGKPAIKGKTGRWVAGTVILLNQGLATLAFFGVGVNLVMFLTRVLGQDNASAANNVSKWTGTVYIFSLIGAFLSDSYWGRYKTCVVFQFIFILGLSSLSFTSQVLLVEPKGCGGDAGNKCRSHSTVEITLFYLSIYLVALGNGGYQPNIASFGADQFDEYGGEKPSKSAFFSYFYLALNLGSLFSNTVLSYLEDKGLWVVGFWASAASAAAALAMFSLGIPRYRHFTPCGNPLSRVCQVLLVAAKNWRVPMPKDGKGLYELGSDDDSTAAPRRIMHTHGFKFLDRAAYVSSRDVEEQTQWEVCPISQVEEVKCVLRLLPIWLCTILYSVVFTQMSSLFVEQGAAMRTSVKGFRVPPASMSSFDILSVACSIFLHRKVIDPVVSKVKKKKRPEEDGLSELQRMGIGLVIAVMAMAAAAAVECYRLRNARDGWSSSVSILWQIPQYSLIGASEVFMYITQLEFFHAQAPHGLKSFGSALSMMSISLGNYTSSLLVSVVMKISGGGHAQGWIPGNLNKGHLDRFFILLALLTTADLIIYIVCAKCYKSVKLQRNTREGEDLNAVNIKEIQLLPS